jgi:hypothetical protein
VAIIKRVVCLANSRKLQGRCVAGRELVGGRPGAWIRPVSDRPKEEVSEYERQYEDGSDPRVLDIIDVPLQEPRPKGYQQENWLLDPEEYWVRAGQLSWGDLAPFAEVGGTLWINGYHTSNGYNDSLPLDAAAAVTTSLKLIRVESIRLSVFRPGEAFGDRKRRVQASFSFDGRDYALWVTDPPIEQDYKSRPDGEYQVGESYLTVSLGEPFNNNCYKLVAAVIRP